MTLQEGADGSEEITYETTMIDGAVTDRQAVAYNVLQAPTPEITVTGTKLKNGMIAKVGSGSFIWPVPNYKYVSRWMGNGHRGADICAAYGTPILPPTPAQSLLQAGIIPTELCGDRPRQRLQDAVRSHVQHRCFSGAGRHAGAGHRLCRLHRQLTGNHCHFEMSYNGALFSAYTLFSGM